MSTKIGNARFHADKRKIAGVLFGVSITVCFFPLARVAPFVNGNGETADGRIELAALVANLIILAMGIVGIALAWAELIHEYSNPKVTLAVSVFEVLAFVPCVTDIVMIGKMTNTGKAFIPDVHKPTEEEVWFVGIVGMLGAGTFCLFFFGSYALLLLALYAYQTGKVESRNSWYYRSRLTLYSSVVAVAGATQLILGAYILDHFGSGPLSAPISVAMFMVWFPEINVFVGSLYIFNGVFGMYRGISNSKDPFFAMAMGVQLLCTLILMVAVQTWYAPGNQMASASPTIANLTLGVSFMPVFLEYSSRSQPDEITQDYYYCQSNKADKVLPLQEEFEMCTNNEASTKFDV